MKELAELGFVSTDDMHKHDELCISLQYNGAGKWTNLHSGSVYRGSRSAFVHYVRRLMYYIKDRRASFEKVRNRISDSVPPAGNSVL